MNPKTKDSVSVAEARHVLGDKAKNLSDNQIQDLISLFDNLASAWLDDFEINTFGRTIESL